MQRFFAVTPPSVHSMIKELAAPRAHHACSAAAPQHRHRASGGRVTPPPATDQNHCGGVLGTPMTKTKLLYTGLAGLMLGSFSVGTVFAKPAAPKAPELTLLKDVAWTPDREGGGRAARDGADPGRCDEGRPPRAISRCPTGLREPAPPGTPTIIGQVLIQGKMTHWAAEGGSEKDAKATRRWTISPSCRARSPISRSATRAPIASWWIVQKGKSDFINAKVVAKVENKEEKMAAAPAAAPGRCRRSGEDPRRGSGSGRYSAPRQEVTLLGSNSD